MFPPIFLDVCTHSPMTSSKENGRTRTETRPLLLRFFPMKDTLFYHPANTLSNNLIPPRTTRVSCENHSRRFSFEYQIYFVSFQSALVPSNWIGKYRHCIIIKLYLFHLIRNITYKFDIHQLSWNYFIYIFLVFSIDRSHMQIALI